MMIIRYRSIISSCFLIVFLHFVQSDDSPVIDISEANLENTLKSHEVVLVNFYADWCHFSQMLSPIFVDAAKRAKEEFKESGKVAFAKVDCDREVNVAQKFHVSKYPTLKIFRHGEAMKREYRGQRSADAMIEFLKEQVADKIHYVATVNDFSFEENKRYIIGHFTHTDSPSLAVFKKVAAQYRDDCTFIIANASSGAGESIAAQESKNAAVRYSGNGTSLDDLLQWTRERCVPLVRQITFNNAEELTEEGLPFLLLFHKMEDTESVRLFHEAVKRELLHERYSVNFLSGDGMQFSHPLHHLGKSGNDLPIICIDSFRHMYLYPKSTTDALTRPGALRKFVEDLHSGKLHREFHNGPDPEPETPKPEEPKAEEPKVEGKAEPAGDQQHVPRDGNAEGGVPRGRGTTPPVSMFRLLQPSSNRYTILKDEL